ncbi:MAG: hypothetical protein MJ072_00410, partial [Clostridia bacterium]|nr:hypothetical protein [Clostridia bacterium]
YGIILLVLPSFAFGGPSCLITLLNNLFAFGKGLGDPESSFLIFIRIFQTVLYVVLIVCFVISAKKKHKLWQLGVFAYTALLNVDSICLTYNYLFMIAPIILFLNEEKLKGVNVWYFVFLILPLLHFPISAFDVVELTPLVSLPNVQGINILRNELTLLVSTVGLTVLSVIDTFRGFSVRKENTVTDKSTPKSN